MEIKNLSICYGENVIYKNFSLDINDGETLCIMGGSGSGKTTLLKAIAQIVPYDGEIDSIKKIGYVFQNPTLISLITCEENCLFVMNKEQYSCNKTLNCDAQEDNVKNLSCNAEVEDRKEICNKVEAEDRKNLCDNTEVENRKEICNKAEAKDKKNLSDNTEVENWEKDVCVKPVSIKNSIIKWKVKRKDNKDVIKKMHKKVAEVFASLGITECLKKLPTQISGGQASRVAIARALCYDAPILLLDEPFKGLDMAIKFQILTMFIKAAKMSKKTVIFVSHDLEDCLNFGDRLIVFEREDNINGIKIAGDFVIPHDKQSSVDEIIHDKNMINNVDKVKEKNFLEILCEVKENELTKKNKLFTEDRLIKGLEEYKLNYNDKMNIIRDSVYKILLKNVKQ